MKPMNDPAKDAYFEPARYASKLAALISEHQSKDERPDWWQQVVAELHGLLDKQFPPFYDCEECGAALYAAFATCEECGHKFNQGADVVPPWKGGSAPDELPDFFRLPEMAPTRMNLLDWRQNGFEQRIGDLEARLAWFPADVIPPYKGRPDKECPVCGEPEDKPHAPDCEYAVLDSLHLPGMENSRLNAMDWRFNGIEERLGTIESNASAFRLTTLEKRLAALEDWADIDFDWPNNKETPNCIHELIAEGMTGVTADMHEQLERLEQRNAERLRTVYGAINAVAGSAKPEIDRLNKRIDELGDVLIKALQSIDALETKTPC